MLGFGFGKLVVLGVIVLVVWYGWKYHGRVEAVRQALKREHDRRTAPPRATVAAEDLVKCERCGAYVAARGNACARADCPRKG